eukprot:SAG31_NODE_3633_length_4043_cov_5.462982_3_plen_233_part_00
MGGDSSSGGSSQSPPQTIAAARAAAASADAAAAAIAAVAAETDAETARMAASSISLSAHWGQLNLTASVCQSVKNATFKSLVQSVQDSEAARIGCDTATGLAWAQGAVGFDRERRHRRARRLMAERRLVAQSQISAIIHSRQRCAVWMMFAVCVSDNSVGRYRCLQGTFDHTSDPEAMKEATATIDEALSWRRKLRHCLIKCSGLEGEVLAAELEFFFGPVQCELHLHFSSC